MSWEPTDAEGAAYRLGASAGAEQAPAWEPGRGDYITRAGLRAAYAQLQQRLRVAPPIMEYEVVLSVGELQARASVGWRFCAELEAGVLVERERPDPPEPAP